jgi:hypothetical protein
MCNEEFRFLFEDIAMFPGIINENGNPEGLNLWIGPANTVTHFHHDVVNVLFTQIHGRKNFKLVSPLETHLLYNDYGVFSEVDPDRPDLARHPLFRSVRLHEVVLEPGDVIFLPVGWWHHVRALDVSISLSYSNFMVANEFFIEF